MMNILSVDVEDRLQAPSRRLDESDSASFDVPEIEENVRMLLDLFGEYKATATFFVSGSIAERSSRLVKTIQDRGHEIASHGYSHEPVYGRSAEFFEHDLVASLDILERITGRRPCGYRAPFWSITKRSLWALDILQRHGIRYDSSIYPTSNYLYGIPDAPRIPYLIPGSSLMEFPGSTASVCGFTVPFGGGVYLRGLPFAVTRSFMSRVNGEGHPCIIYVHPHEFSNKRYPLPYWHTENAILSWGRSGLLRKMRRLLSLGGFGSFQRYLDKKRDLAQR